MSILTEIERKLDERRDEILKVRHGELTFKIQDGKVVLTEINNKYK